MSREIKLWWEQSADYWELPFFADMGLCCEGLMLDRDDELCAREQLFAIRELGEESGSEPLHNATMDQIREVFADNKTAGGTGE